MDVLSFIDAILLGALGIFQLTHLSFGFEIKESVVGVIEPKMHARDDDEVVAEIVDSR